MPGVAPASSLSHPQSHPLFQDPSLRYARVERAGDEPAPERGVVDVAVLDMNHGYPNMGHASIVEVLLTIANEIREELGNGAPHFRVISYEIRRAGAVPRLHGHRFPIMVGTGGPGALDPRGNDGVSNGSQDVVEDPRWEAPLWRLFDGVLADTETSLMGICHSFGLLARWSGVARPFLRTADKGGKSMGAVKNLLTPEAQEHPYFSGLYRAAGGPEIEVLDSRLWDLHLTGQTGACPLAFEAGPDGGPGEAVTMLEFARAADGQMPRIWGVNHHPEIGDRGRQRERLQRLEARGEVTEAWSRERHAALDAWTSSAVTEQRLQLTSAYTFEDPLRRVIRRSLEAG